MLQAALQYLSDPTFFAGFSIIIGVAYVVVWVISLKEIAQPSPDSYFVSTHDEQEFEIPRRAEVSSGKRRNNRVRVRTKFISGSDEQRRGRGARAA